MKVRLILMVLLFPFISSQCAVSQPGKNKPALVHPLSGTWLLNLNTKDIGEIRTIMTITADTGTFEGHTREGADRSVIGFPKAMLGRIFTNYFTKGALVHLEQGVLKKTGNNEYKVAALLRSASGTYLFQGIMKDSSLTGKLTDGKENHIGELRGRKGTFTYPLDNYQPVVTEAIELTKTRIFSKDQVKTKDWKNFEKNVVQVAAKAQDDLEMVFGFYYYASKLPFSHYALYRKKEEDPEAPADATTISAENFITFTSIRDNVGYLKITSFEGSAHEIDSVFSVIKSTRYPNLIIDLRGNTGGNISGLKVVTNLADKPYPGGAFVTNKWFDKHNNPPTPEQMQNFTALKEANLSLLWEGIHNLDGLAIKVIPEKTIYKGKVFVLTNNATASTCEPIVYGLKHYKLATIVGEKTAGAMLNGESFHIKDWWHVTIPTADYYTPDGKRLDQVGVIPDIKVDASEALDYVLKNLIN